MVEIEPCPWCGDEQVSGEYRRCDGHRYGCACGASGPFCQTLDKALTEWNRVAGDRWRPVPLPDDRRDVMVHVKPGRGATHWRRVTEPPEPAPIETSGYVELTGKEPSP